MWQISGLPCTHAIACIFKMNKMVEDYVPACFRKEMYSEAYSQYMKPVEGISFWPDCSDLSRILGPKPKKMPGRPRKKRIRAPHESKSTTRISKAGVTMTCQNCGETGHNKASCKKDPISKPPKVQCKGGRPKKNIPGTSINRNDAVNVVGIQQSQVAGAASNQGTSNVAVNVEGTPNGAASNQGSKVRQTKSATISSRRLQVAATQITNDVELVDEPRHETRSADPQPRQQRRSQQPFVSPRVKSQRILNKK